MLKNQSYSRAPATTKLFDRHRFIISPSLCSPETSILQQCCVDRSVYVRPSIPRVESIVNFQGVQTDEENEKRKASWKYSAQH